jgi:hypothetical protein
VVAVEADSSVAVVSEDNVPAVASFLESMEAVSVVVRSKVAILVAVVSSSVLVVRLGARVEVVPSVDAAPRRVRFSGSSCNTATPT